MYQKRATLTETLDKPAEVDTTDHPKPVHRFIRQLERTRDGPSKTEALKEIHSRLPCRIGPRPTHQGGTPAHHS